MAPVQLRSAAEADLPSLVAIEMAAGAGRWNRAAFADELLSKNAILRVAVDGDTVVGFIVYWIVAGEVQLQNMATARSHQRCGIARVLIGRMLEDARASAAARVDLEVREGNEPAQALYRSCGFEIVGRRAGYYGDTGEAAILMRLEPV